MAAFTRSVTGEPVPKQYCSSFGGEPLVRRALRRAAGAVPRSRTLVVVAQEHRRHWSEVLADLPRENIIVQPRNRGTASGLLLPVLEILLRRDRNARLLLLPADHHVDSEHVLRDAMEAATRRIRRSDAPVVLLGMVGVDGDHEYGWIVPATGPTQGLRRVRSFVEKPDPETSHELMRSGALVNSFILVCRGRALLQLYEDALPGLLRALVPVVLAGCQDATLREFYDAIPSRDFSRAVLERSVRSLAVLRVLPCGWSDLGTASRLERFLGRPLSGHKPIPSRKEGLDGERPATLDGVPDAELDRLAALGSAVGIVKEVSPMTAERSRLDEAREGRVL